MAGHRILQSGVRDPGDDCRQRGYKYFYAAWLVRFLPRKKRMASPAMKEKITVVMDDGARRRAVKPTSG